MTTGSTPDSVDLAKDISKHVIHAFETSDDLFKFLKPGESKDEGSLEEFTMMLTRLKVLEMQLKMDYARHIHDTPHKIALFTFASCLFSLIDSSVCNLLNSVLDDKEKEVFSRCFPKWYPHVFKELDPLDHIPENAEGEDGAAALVSAMKNLKTDLENAKKSMQP